MAADAGGSAGRISAVFFLHVSAWAAPMLSGWLDAGHRIDAVVVMAPRKRRRRPPLSSALRRIEAGMAGDRLLRRHRIPKIELAAPVDWISLADRLRPIGSDIAISMGFMRLIPEAVLDLFPHGGVNLHPALLPDYGGPNPIHCLVRDDAYRVHGGVTLHRMNDRFDRGDLLAKVPFSAADWRSRTAHLSAVASANRSLVLEAVPRLLAGTIRGMAQPTGSHAWAKFDFRPIAVDAGHTIAHVRTLIEFLGRTPGVHIEADGRLVRLGSALHEIGPPSGSQPRVTPARIEFDLRDARVACFRHVGFIDRLGRFLDRLRALRPAARPMTVQYFEQPGVRRDP